jgi:hypothetical protein
VHEAGQATAVELVALVKERAMTVRDTAENIAKTIDSMAEEIATRSVPSSDESFREWSSHRLHERIKTHACSVILDYLLGDFQTLDASRATRNDELRQSEQRPRAYRQPLRRDLPESRQTLKRLARPVAPIPIAHEDGAVGTWPIDSCRRKAP